MEKYYWSMSDQDIHTIAEKVKEHKYIVIDDKTGEHVRILGLVKTKAQIVGAILDNNIYNIRGVYIDHISKKPHMSRTHVGEKIVENNIIRYNKSIEFSKYRIIESILF